MDKDFCSTTLYSDKEGHEEYHICRIGQVFIQPVLDKS